MNVKKEYAEANSYASPIPAALICIALAIVWAAKYMRQPNT